jgi:hypothetical protein
MQQNKIVMWVVIGGILLVVTAGGVSYFLTQTTGVSQPRSASTNTDRVTISTLAAPQVGTPTSTQKTEKLSSASQTGITHNQSRETAQPTSGMISLKATSSAWIDIPFTVVDPINELRFDYMFTSSAEGLLTIFFDNNEVFKADERSTLEGINDSSFIPLGAIAPGTHRLAIRLDSFHNTLSEVKIANLRTGTMQYVPSTEVPPIANAGLPQTVRQGSVVILDGSGSVDTNKEAPPLKFAWAQTAGPTVSLQDPDTVNPRFVPTQNGVYAFQLVVFASETHSLPATVTITVTATGTQ